MRPGVARIDLSSSRFSAAQLVATPAYHRAVVGPIGNVDDTIWLNLAALVGLAAEPGLSLEPGGTKHVVVAVAHSLLVLSMSLPSAKLYAGQMN